MTRFINQCRPLAWLALAVVAATPMAGCHSLAPKSTTTVAGTSTTLGGTEPAGPKTEFHREVGPDQEYNVHVELARFHETQGDNESAVVEYQKAVDVCEKRGSTLAGAKLGPTQQSLAQRRMAASLDRMGRFAQAEPHYLKALKLTPGDPKVWNDAGYSYYLQGRLADAERAFKTADSLGPNNALVQTNLGLVLAAEGKDHESFLAFTKAGGPAVGHANLGYILASMGKTGLARQHYQSALKLQPELAAARQALAKLSGPSVAPTTALASAAGPAATETPARPVVPTSLAVGTIPLPAVKDPKVTRTSAPRPKPVTDPPIDKLPALPPG